MFQYYSKTIYMSFLFGKYWPNIVEKLFLELVYAGVACPVMISFMINTNPAEVGQSFQIAQFPANSPSRPLKRDKHKIYY